MAVLKAGMDREIVDLATQLGASEIMFFPASRSEGKLHSEKLEKLQKTAISAIKQCGRARLPQMRYESNLKHLFDSLGGYKNRFLAHPLTSECKSVRSNEQIIKSSAVVLIGPEGGFTDEEVQLALSNGCQPLGLGKRRLRAEVAVAASLAHLLSLSNEIHSV